MYNYIMSHIITRALFYSNSNEMSCFEMFFLVSFSGNMGQTSPTNPAEKKPRVITWTSQDGFHKSKNTNPHDYFIIAQCVLCFSYCLVLQTDTRRITHISAEQKRRFNIKLGFDTLHSLVTTLSSQPSIKVTLVSVTLSVST